MGIYHEIVFHIYIYRVAISGLFQYIYFSVSLFYLHPSGIRYFAQSGITRLNESHRVT